MAKFRKVPETLQLPNPSDLSSTPSASASRGTFDARSEPRSRGRLLKVLGMWFGISAAVGNTIAAGIVRALGEYAGFIVGWSDWLSTCGTAAAVAIVIAEYSGELIRTLNGHVNLIAVLIIFGFFVLQWRGIKWGSGTQLVTA